MKLKTFNTQNTRMGGRSLKPAIRINSKGLITINRSAANCMQLKAGDRIVLHQDELRPKDWYMEKTTSDNGFAVRACYSNQAAGTVMFNSAELQHEILKSLGKEDMSSAGIPVGQKPVDGKYFPLLTAGLYA